MKIGIICDLKYERHHLFKSYYYAVQNIYGCDPVIINTPDDLKGVDILFIGDDHYGVHKDIWMKCINYCNQHQIRVVVLTNEKVKNSYFPWNEENLAILCQFNHLYHYMNDVDDCIQYHCRLNRTAPSYQFKNDFMIEGTKKYKHMIFIGKITCPKNSYNERAAILRELQKFIRIDIYSSTIPSWMDYLKLVSKYKYVFSPIGNGNFFPMRFYEALALNSIPVHQVRENTLEYYNVEKGFEDALFFKEIAEIPKLLENCKLQESYNKIWMEDGLRYNLELDNLL